MPSRKQPSLSDLLSEVGAGLERVALRPDLNSYVPHDKQVKFHASQSKGRLYIGGNRSGKTVGGIVECLWWLLHKHPYRKTPKGPIRGRLVCVDFPNGWEKICKPVVMQWVPPSSLIGGSWEQSFDKRNRTLHFANGSFLEIMSYDQEVEAFAGASRHFTMFDEEPPEAIWTECRYRLMDTGGSWWISMTPVEGLEWIEDKLYNPFIEHGLNTELKVDVIQVNTEENLHLSPVEVEEAYAGMEDDEIEVRKKGKFVRKGGLIYPDFDPRPKDGHVIPPIDPTTFPPGTRIIASMDHGFNHPTAWYWHAVLMDGRVITFAEHHRSNWTVAQHAEAVKQKELELGIVPEFRVADPATKQTSAINGNSIQLEYRLHGVTFILGNNDVHTGLVRVAEYIRQAQWFITEDCPMLIWELRRYQWKVRDSAKLQAKHGKLDQPKKKDDDGCDSCRYFFMCLPELTPTDLPVDLKRVREQIQALLGGVQGYRIDRGRRDPNAWRKTLPRESHITTDEYMGGIW